MNRSSTTNLNTTTPSIPSTQASRRKSANSTRYPHDNSSIYDSALESDLTMYTSFEGSANNNSKYNSSGGLNLTVEGMELNFNSLGNSSRGTGNSNINASMLLLQSESANTSQEEVDPKSQLANKTIFKTDNPNLSIIEISGNPIKDQELANSVLLIETSSDDDLPAGPSPSARSRNSLSPRKMTTAPESAADKRRKKAETLIHSSKQKLNIAIAEASASESVSTVGDADHQDRAEGGAHAIEAVERPDTKREIKVYDTIEDFEKHLPSTVTVLDTPYGSKVYLVGTAHFSEESQDDVSYVIRNVRPDVVMVELCPSRIHILKLDEKTLLEEAKKFNFAKIRSIIHAHGYINGIFFIMLLQMSAQIAKDLGMAPGGEFRRAFEEIHKLPGCMLHLGDRPIRVTLHRALHALSFWQTCKLVWRLTSTDTISIEEVEECKQRDLLEKLMQEMAGEFPAFSDVFVKERDLFLCHSLQLAALPQVSQGKPHPVRVVGVVGIGHANGIAELWGRVDPQKIPAIMEIPPASVSTRICKYTVKYGFIGLTLYGAFKFLRPCVMRLF